MRKLPSYWHQRAPLALVMQKFGIALAISLFLFIQITPVVHATPQTDAYSEGALYFNVGNDSCSSDGSTDGTTTGGKANGGFTLDQVKTFLSEPVASTWNISDNAAEHWFLRQSNAQPVIARYGLNSSNIGQITSTVEAANVSPVLFYLIAVNEGGTGDGGANDGFINYTDRGSDTGVQAAQADAQRIITDVKSSDPPATGGGEPDMPTAEAQSILTALPSGSIGDYYIRATAAATAELETLSGKTGDWSGKYGTPLETAMQHIKDMGGDPEQGGSTVSTVDDCTSGTVTGEGMQEGISFAEFIANDDGYGYDQLERTTGWEKYQSDPTCTTQCGSFDCSSFVSAILTEAGYFKTNPNFDTKDEASALTQAGFTEVATSAHTSAGLQPGDILITDDHTEMYIGNNQNVGAHDGNNNNIDDPQVGDQAGQEISVTSFYDDAWNGVYRAPN